MLYICEYYKKGAIKESVQYDSDDFVLGSRKQHLENLLMHFQQKRKVGLMKKQAAKISQLIILQNTNMMKKIEKF